MPLLSSTSSLAVVPEGCPTFAGDALATPFELLQEKDTEQMLAEALRDVDVARARARHAEREMWRCREALQSLKGSLRVFAKVAPAPQAHCEEDNWLQVVGPNELQVVADSSSQESGRGRARRMSTGTLRDCVSPERRRCEKTPRLMHFEHVFGHKDDEQVFEAFRPDLAAAMDGEAVCCLAYGTSDSGKSSAIEALAEKVALELEQHAANLLEDTLASVEASLQMFELEGEQIRDLLEVGSASGSPIERLTCSSHSAGARRLSLGGGAAAAAAEAVAVWNSVRTEDAAIGEVLIRWLSSGWSRRAPASLQRSHLIITFRLTGTKPGSEEKLLVGRLTLVDLAASDRSAFMPSPCPSPTQDPGRSENCACTGGESKEAQTALRSLKVLFEVIQARESGCSHVPYRKSKLTHLLQEPLGGCQDTCRTVVLLMLEPSLQARADTLRTLQFGNRLCSSSSAHAQGSGPRHSFLAEESQDFDNNDDNLRAEIERWKADCAKVWEELPMMQQQLDEKNRAIEEVRAHSCTLEPVERLVLGLKNNIVGGLEKMQAYQEQRMSSANSTCSGLTRSEASTDALRPAAEQRELRRTGIVRGRQSPGAPLASSSSSSLDAQRMRPVLRSGGSQGTFPRPGSPPRMLPADKAAQSPTGPRSVAAAWNKRTNAPRLAKSSEPRLTQQRAISPAATSPSRRPAAKTAAQTGLRWRQERLENQKSPHRTRAVGEPSATAQRARRRMTQNDQEDLQKRVQFQLQKRQKQQQQTSQALRSGAGAAATGARSPLSAASAGQRPLGRRLGPRGAAAATGPPAAHQPVVKASAGPISRPAAIPKKESKTRTECHNSSPDSESSCSDGWGSDAGGIGERPPQRPQPKDLLPLKLDLTRVFQEVTSGAMTARYSHRGPVPETPRGRPPVVWWQNLRHEEEEALVAPASARGHAPAVVAASGSRRRQTSREYVVEVLSPDVAAQNDAGCESPVLVLRPPDDSDAHMQCGEGCLSEQISPGEVSISSDEGQIRNRLQEELVNRVARAATAAFNLCADQACDDELGKWAAEEKVESPSPRKTSDRPSVPLSLPTPSRSPRLSGSA
mmetsp:Transcript_105339/g.187261  ORF Transcript_105339/g.187261 Transcript_105339/m.187261 type:complete len:1081 (+) Transcript_105339:78-3320(+)